MKAIIIQGSARSQGNSYQIAQILAAKLQAPILDLNTKQLEQYKYTHTYDSQDQFLEVVDELLEYDTFIFLTPVYWYSMSGIMKLFFDRLTDCLKIAKDKGRRLRGKQMAAVACGSDATVVNGFFVPFESSAEYLGMQYLGDLHAWVEDEVPSSEVVNLIHDFTTNIKAQSSSKFD